MLPSPRSTPSLPKRFSEVALALLLVFCLGFVVACGGGPSGDDGGDGDAAPERKFLSIGTAPAGGTFFVVGGALAEVANAHGADYGWQVTAEATQGSQENIRRLAAGELDFALSNAAITYFAVRGGASWDQEYDVRAVMTLAPNIAFFVAPEGSGVTSIADLAGERVTVGPAGAGFEMFVGPLVEAHGVTYDDFTPLNATQSGAVELLSDGSVAAAFLGGGVPTASITQASSSMDLVFVPLDDDAKAKLVEEYPFFHEATVPAGTYRGQDEPLDVLNVGSMHLISGADVPEETVYRMTKLIWEQRAAVVERHPAAKAIQEKIVVRDTGTPFHPGAIRFYEEIGIWPGSGDAGDAADGTDVGNPATGDEGAGDESNGENAD